MKTSQDAAIAIRGERFKDAAEIYATLAEHAAILRKPAKVNFYKKLAQENFDIATKIDIGRVK